jgi:rubrerythrin
MPGFCSAFSGLASDRKLTESELIRAIRFMVAAEYEAIQLYMQLAESTDNQLASQVLADIADEERVHAGEFLRLLKELAPDEESFYQEGAEEVETEFMGETASSEEEKTPQNASAGSSSTGSLGIGSLKSV